MPKELHNDLDGLEGWNWLSLRTCYGLLSPATAKAINEERNDNITHLKKKVPLHLPIKEKRRRHTRRKEETAGKRFWMGKECCCGQTERWVQTSLEIESSKRGGSGDDQTSLWKMRYLNQEVNTISWSESQVSDTYLLGFDEPSLVTRKIFYKFMINAFFSIMNSLGICDALL